MGETVSGLEEDSHRLEALKAIIQVSKSNLKMAQKEAFFCIEEMMHIKVRFFNNHEIMKGATECQNQAQDNLNLAIQSLSHWQKQLNELLKQYSPEQESQSLKLEYGF